MSLRRGLTTAIAVLAASASCKSTPPSTTDVPGTGGSTSGSGGSPDATGGSVTGGGLAAGGSSAAGGALAEPTPKLYPIPGFQTCVHAEVTADCSDGWCKLPPSCFVMGSPEGEWHRGLDSENQVAVTLTHSIEVQQKELTRAEWTQITGLSPRGPDSCTESNCPVSMVSWWDAVHAANLLSEQRSLEPCYEPIGCTGSLGQDLACSGVADPDKSVYDCEGYRLPTRAEAEYAARAGTWSTFYSGDITEYDDSASCLIDPALEKISWYCFNSGNRAHQGGQLQPNGFGLYDMIGNLGEWSNEWQHGDSSPGGENPRGTISTGERRLHFSPQYDANNYLARTAGLLSVSWGDRGQQLGFRMVRTLPD